MGGGGKGGSAPSTPNYEAIAREQAAGNLKLAKYATQANRPTQITPWGTISWDSGERFDEEGYNRAMENYQRQLSSYNAGGGAPGRNDFLTDYALSMIGLHSGSPIPVGSAGARGSAPVAPTREQFMTGGNDWTQTMTLSPEMQALFDQSMRLEQGLFGAQNLASDRVNEMMAQGFNVGELPAAGQVYDPSLATNNATDLILQRLDPQFDRQLSQLQAQLANQGVTQGSAAYNTALDNFMQQRHAAEREASLAGIGLGMQQQGLMFNQSEQARQRALAEQAYLRALPLNELNALRTGTQVSMPQFPGFSQQATTAGPDLLGAAQAGYQADLGRYNAQQAAGGSLMSGLFGIGGSLLGAAGQAGGFGALFSDRRLKRDIKRIGRADNGLNIYSYQYVWGGPYHIGYMADEVEAIAPHAVHDVGGYQAVDYGAI